MTGTTFDREAYKKRIALERETRRSPTALERLETLVRAANSPGIDAGTADAQIDLHTAALELTLTVEDLHTILDLARGTLIWRTALAHCQRVWSGVDDEERELMEDPPESVSIKAAFDSAHRAADRLTDAARLALTDFTDQPID